VDVSPIRASSTLTISILGIMIPSVDKRIWAEVNFEPEITSKDHFLDQQLSHNSLIKIANKTVFFKKLVH